MPTVCEPRVGSAVSDGTLLWIDESEFRHWGRQENADGRHTKMKNRCKFNGDQ